MRDVIMLSLSHSLPQIRAVRSFGFLFRVLQATPRATDVGMDVSYDHYNVKVSVSTDTAWPLILLS